MISRIILLRFDQLPKILTQIISLKILKIEIKKDCKIIKHTKLSKYKLINLTKQFKYLLVKVFLIQKNIFFFQQTLLNLIPYNQTCSDIPSRLGQVFVLSLVISIQNKVRINKNQDQFLSIRSRLSRLSFEKYGCVQTFWGGTLVSVG